MPPCLFFGSLVAKFFLPASVFSLSMELSKVSFLSFSEVSIGSSSRPACCELHIPLPSLGGGGGVSLSLERSGFLFSCLAIKANCLFVGFAGSEVFGGFFGLGFADLIGCLC